MVHFVLSKLAYSKLISHALKNPDHSIQGVLIADSKTDSSTKRITDAIPISHLAITTSPTTEIALQQIEIYVKKYKKIIAGYYVAYDSSVKTKGSLNSSGELIAKSLYDSAQDPLLVLVVDPTRFTAAKELLQTPNSNQNVDDKEKEEKKEAEKDRAKTALVTALTFDNSGLTLIKNQFAAISTGTNAVSHKYSINFENSTVANAPLALFNARHHLLVADFNDHLENVTLDWLQNLKFTNAANSV